MMFVLSRMLQEGESREHQAVLNQQSATNEHQGTPKSAPKERQGTPRSATKEHQGTSRSIVKEHQGVTRSSVKEQPAVLSKESTVKERLIL